jgi:hypothetical protein
MNPKKVIVTSKSNLLSKYEKKFDSIDALLTKLVSADAKKSVDTSILYIDDKTSARAAGITAVKSITARNCKKAIDELYKKHSPAYLMIFGAQDIFPFVEIINPAGGDDDETVPSDLPYACEAGYSTSINAFTGPTRVVGRLPDIPGKASVAYVTRLVNNVVKSKPQKDSAYQNYFSVSCHAWIKSTQKSLQAMFGQNNKLLISPPSGKTYTKAQLQAPTHFYNCHGAQNDYNYYGQKGNSYPAAFNTNQLNKQISFGTVVAAECCFGAELVNVDFAENPDDISIANNYLMQGALAFMGSSNVAYGPPDGQGLADLITQYFISFVLQGASSGRAMLQARQKFLEVSGPSLDPYELKTLAQFYLLGDPSVQCVLSADAVPSKEMQMNPTFNNRLNLFNKGVSLRKSIAPSEKVKTVSKSKHTDQIAQLLKKNAFKVVDQEGLYVVKSGMYDMKALSGVAAKKATQAVQFRTFVSKGKAIKKGVTDMRVMVVKETDGDVLGWRVYVRK